MRHRYPVSVLTALVLALTAGCAPPTRGAPDAEDGYLGPYWCEEGEDPDEDRISSTDEGEGDLDGDGIENSRDPDSDDDGIPDLEEAGDHDCETEPVDTDGDGTPDFLDTDSNADGIADRHQAGSDADGDGTLDVVDTDVDGDGIPNEDEAGRDTDGDGTLDVLDDDSDGDTISDADEGRSDIDGDGAPNFRDTDSDGDGIDDRTEAGDDDITTPPASCDAEIDPITGSPAGDGFADFVDGDSDNDGLSDAEEPLFGTDLCNVDSDGDGMGDLAEAAFELVNCPDRSSGLFCGCASSPGCTIPEEHYYLVLRYGADPVERDLHFGTAIRSADIFFLTDTTGSMIGTLHHVQRTVGRAETGLIHRIGEAVPDAWFGGGGHDDFPFGDFGDAADEPFRLAIAMTPPTLPGSPSGSGREAVASAFEGLTIHAGGDGPEAHTEALYQLATGEGGTWEGAGMRSTYTMPRYSDDCLDTGWGAPCFRFRALPIVVHFSDTCAHNGPPVMESLGCSAFYGITPRPARWSETIDLLRLRGVRYIGINAGFGNCDEPGAREGYGPCGFMWRTAEETGSVDLDGRPLVYDLPNESSEAEFVDTVVAAVETMVSRVPLDLQTGVRDDPSDAEEVDATRFVVDREPACHASPSEPCWWAAEGVAHEDAVRSFDESTFYRVVPGTRVRFHIAFGNDFYRGGLATEVFVAFIDVQTPAGAVLDTRQVFVVVPASSTLVPD